MTRVRWALRWLLLAGSRALDRHGLLRAAEDRRRGERGRVGALVALARDRRDRGVALGRLALPVQDLALQRADQAGGVVDRLRDQHVDDEVLTDLLVGRR